jgi:hypothetical protein
MATINITNTSIQYTGEAFQGNVTFDLNATDTEVKLDVGFKVNLAAQLNFKSIDYNSNGFFDWSKKRLNSLDERERAWILGRFAVSSILSGILRSQSFDPYHADALDQFFAIIVSAEITELFCGEFGGEFVGMCRLTEDEKAQLFGLAVISPSGQNASTHTIEFSVPINSLLNRELERLSKELREEFLAIAGHKLDLWLSAELELSSGHTNGQFQYNVG